jgi:hypothetical protein
MVVQMASILVLFLVIAVVAILLSRLRGVVVQDAVALDFVKKLYLKAQLVATWTTFGPRQPVLLLFK